MLQGRAAQRAVGGVEGVWGREGDGLNLAESPCHPLGLLLLAKITPMDMEVPILKRMKTGVGVEVGETDSWMIASVAVVAFRSYYTDLISVLFYFLHHHH